MSEETRLYEILTAATEQWMADNGRSIYDALGEAHIFAEHLRVTFELDLCNAIRARLDKAARMAQGKGHAD